ncbi:hypothetical protein N7456_013191 [Penicillium angulare]|uniref:Uncharacterized protein n=1 Tax=Penicillium angulare TaxID=116970 RepID=A0A9W9EL55_9EURO|nr:hypothetical protein N7456_013191 [Penicillium angulare]
MPPALESMRRNESASDQYQPLRNTAGVKVNAVIVISHNVSSEPEPKLQSTNCPSLSLSAHLGHAFMLLSLKDEEDG